MSGGSLMSIKHAKYSSVAQDDAPRPNEATRSRPSMSPDNCSGLKSRGNTSKAIEENLRARRQLGWAAVFCFVFMICEIIGGFFANSLAIMTDAAHLLSDLAGFFISIFALWLANRPATSRLSFGFHRAEILGALMSVILIWLLTGVLLYEACWRLANPENVDGRLMFIIAVLGLICNGIMGFVLARNGHSHGLGDGHNHGSEDAEAQSHAHSHEPKEKETSHSFNTEDSTTLLSFQDGRSDRTRTQDHGHSHNQGSNDTDTHHSDTDNGSGEEEQNLNVKAAFIHVLGDALQSVGVMIAAALIWYNPEWRAADPICTFFFSILVLFTTTRLIKQSVGVLMEGVPDGIDPDAVQTSLSTVPGVISVHDLHVWSLSVGKPALSAHLFCRDDAKNVLAACSQLLANTYNIHHSTLQIERQHDEIECNDAFVSSLDRITSTNFGEFGISSQA